MPKDADNWKLLQEIFGWDGIDIRSHKKAETIRDHRTAIPVQQTPSQVLVLSKIWEKPVIKRYSLSTMRAYISCLELFFAHYPDRDPDTLGEEEIKA